MNKISWTITTSNRRFNMYDVWSNKRALPKKIDYSATSQSPAITSLRKGIKQVELEIAKHIIRNRENLKDGMAHDFVEFRAKINIPLTNDAQLKSITFDFEKWARAAWRTEGPNLEVMGKPIYFYQHEEGNDILKLNDYKLDYPSARYADMPKGRLGLKLSFNNPSEITNMGQNPSRRSSVIIPPDNFMKALKLKGPLNSSEFTKRLGLIAEVSGAKQVALNKYAAAADALTRQLG